MEHNLTNPHSKKQDFRPEFLEDSEFDNINFKAITEGLGFHHGDEKLHSGSLKEISRPAVKAKVPAVKQAVNQEQAKPQTYMNGLEAFYKETPTTEREVVKKTKKKIKVAKKYKEAKMAERIFAYITDLFVIAAFMALTFGLIFILSGVEYALVSKLLTREELFSYATVLFALNYLLYFTILEIKATPGKLLVGIKVVNANGKPISAFKACGRALITLVLLPVFIVMGLKLQDALLSSKVVTSEKA